MNSNFEIINGKKYKKCKENQIRNLNTNKCVSKTGKIGKLLLKQVQPNEPKQKKGTNLEISNQDCIKWLSNKLINPKTNRKITEKSQIYKSLNKKCNIINEKAKKIQRFFLSKFKKVDEKDVKKVDKKDVKKDVKKVDKKEVKKVDEKEVKKEVKKVDKKDVKKSINNSSCIIKIGDDLIIDDKIKLDKPFGSKSVFGINYISHYLNDKDFKFSSKIQFYTREAKKEFEYLKVLNDFRKDKNFIHFPLLYDYTICPSNKFDNKEDLPPFFQIKKKVGYIVIFNELLSGDLKNYIYEIAKNNYELWLNAIEQIYMAIASLHSLGLNHKDSHYGNFLYKEVEKGGYFHYKINDEDYFIPNLGYMWVIWDFGVSYVIHRHYDYVEDYNYLCLSLRYNNEKLITPEFKRKFLLDDKKKPYRDYGFIDSSLVKIPKEIEKLVEELWKYSGADKDITAKLDKEKLTEDKWLKTLKSNGIFMTHKPSSSSKIVNSMIFNYQKLTKENPLLINKKDFSINYEKFMKL